MYEIKLDMFGDLEAGENPIFTCKDIEELVTIMEFFMKNDFDVLIRKISK
jgi:hypothetical protein